MDAASYLQVPPSGEVKIMPMATKLSQTYDPVEDRLLLISQDDQGHVYRLWLTQRIATDVVLALTGWLENQPESPLEAACGPVAQVWQQAAAVMQYMPATPVGADKSARPATTEGLVQNVELIRGDEAYVLVLSLASGASLTLPFNPTELRQWLSLLHGLYETSGWPLTAWPAWFKRPLATAAPNTVN